MKFVTVMDMWLLIINICMLGGAFYFGRKLLKTMTRLMHVGEQKENHSERQRCIRIIEHELENYRAFNSLHPDPENSQTVQALEFVLDSVKKGR